jgi:GTP-binding protein
MLDYLAELEVPSVIVLTKIDKISRGAVDKRTSDIMESLSLSRDQIIQFSSSTGEGRSELAGAVATLVETARNTSP